MRNHEKQSYKLMDKVLWDFLTSPIQKDSTLYIHMQSVSFTKSPEQLHI